MGLFYFYNNPLKISIMSNRITTKKPLRFSFPCVFEPNTFGDSEKYELTLMIPKDDLEDLQQISSAIEQAWGEGMSGEWAGQPPANFDNPLRDGDDPSKFDPERYPMYKGHYILKLKSSKKPVIVDVYGRPILEASKVYGGCYGAASFYFYAYNNATFRKKGITGMLCAVLKTDDGEPFGSSDVTDVSADFAGFIKQPPAFTGQQTQPAPGQMPFTQQTQPAPGQMPFTQQTQPAPGQMPFTQQTQPAPGQMPFTPQPQPAPGQYPDSNKMWPNPNGDLPF